MYKQKFTVVYTYVHLIKVKMTGSLIKKYLKLEIFSVKEACMLVCVLVFKIKKNI